MCFSVLTYYHKRYKYVSLKNYYWQEHKKKIQSKIQIISKCVSNALKYILTQIHFYLVPLKYFQMHENKVYTMFQIQIPCVFDSNSSTTRYCSFLYYSSPVNFYHLQKSISYTTETQC